MYDPPCTIKLIRPLFPPYFCCFLKPDDQNYLNTARKLVPGGPRRVQEKPGGAQRGPGEVKSTPGIGTPTNTIKTLRSLFPPYVLCAFWGKISRFCCYFLEIASLSGWNRLRYTCRPNDPSASLLATLQNTGLSVFAKSTGCSAFQPNLISYYTAWVHPTPHLFPRDNMIDDVFSVGIRLDLVCLGCLVQSEHYRWYMCIFWALQ